jgi:hypothetical protein
MTMTLDGSEGTSLLAMIMSGLRNYRQQNAKDFDLMFWGFDVVIEDVRLGHNICTATGPKSNDATRGTRDS